MPGKSEASGLCMKPCHIFIYLSSAESFARTNGLPWLDDKTLDLLKELKMSLQQENYPSSVALSGEIEHKLSSVTETIAKFQTAGRDNSAIFAYCGK